MENEAARDFSCLNNDNTVECKFSCAHTCRLLSLAHSH